MTHLDDLRDTLAHARACHEAWWIFIGDHPGRKHIVQVLNSYVHFFEATRPALYVTFIVKLSSVFGTCSDEITLKAIPDAERQSSFAELWRRGRRLHKYRGKLIAHRDADLHSRSYARESGFTYDDLKALLEDTCQFFDSAAERLHVAPVHGLSCEADFLRLVQHLNKRGAPNDRLHRTRSARR